MTTLWRTHSVINEKLDKELSQIDVRLLNRLVEIDLRPRKK
jgi:hypothetical protein